MGFRIDSQFPPPRIRSRNQYPFKEMKVGQSFLIPAAKVPKGPIHGIAARYGMKISIRKQEDGAWRVYRVA